MRTLPSADSEQVHAEDDQHNLGINRTCVWACQKCAAALRQCSRCKPAYCLVLG